MEKLKIIKVGGKVVEDEKSLQLLLNDFVKIKGKKILVHGGGKTATEISAKLGIETKTEANKRVFPKNDKAQDILEALKKELAEKSAKQNGKVLIDNSSPPVRKRYSP